MLYVDTHPADPGGDGPAQPVIDVERQEAAHGDEEGLCERRREGAGLADS